MKRVLLAWGGVGGICWVRFCQRQSSRRGIERWSEETPHLKGSLGWAGSPAQRLDLNRGWTGGLGSEESHRGCALREGETKGFDLMMKGEQMT